MNILQMLMNQLRMRNPQVAKMIEQAQKDKNNPIEIFRQITNNYTPQQLEILFDRAKQFGINEQQINEIKENYKKNE